MTASIFDSLFELDQNNFAISLIKQSSSRKGGRQGDLGFLVIELLDKDQNHVLYKIDFPFGNTDSIQVTTLFKDDMTKGKFLNTFSVKGIHTWLLSKAKLNQAYINNSIVSSTETFIESSYTKALSYLEKHYEITKCPYEDPQYFPEFQFEHTKIHWNPFARLVDNQLFPESRFLFSTLFQRLKDSFFILNGSFKKNDLGILDYFFPIPRLLTNVLAFDLPFIAKIFIAIPTGITYLIKSVLAFSITFVLSPIIGLINLGCKLFLSPQKELEDKLKLRPIKGKIESVYDVVIEKDLGESTSLSSFAKIHQHLTIKPLAITTDSHYEEISPQHPFNRDEHLALGVYDHKTPVAIIEVNVENKPGIFNLMRKNLYKIDNHLEDNNIPTLLS